VLGEYLHGPYLHAAEATEREATGISQPLATGNWPATGHVGKFQLGVFCDLAALEGGGTTEGGREGDVHTHACRLQFLPNYHNFPLASGEGEDIVMRSYENRRHS